jgi:DNA-binding NarL/FixJ family response regulator
VKAVIVDDWGVLRHGVRVILSERGVSTVGQAETGREGLALVTDHHADLLVLGRCADISAIDVLDHISRLDHDVRTVLLLENPARVDGIALLTAGARALLPRTAGEGELLEAVGRVQDGDRFVAPPVLTSMFPTPGAVVQAGAFGLTERERYVLAELVRGRSNREIASALYIGHETVKTHLHHIYEKLDVSGRREAVGRAFELGLVS